MRIGTKILLPYLCLFLLIGTVGTYILVSFGSQQAALTQATVREEHINARVNELNILEHDAETSLLSYYIDRNPQHLNGIEKSC